MRIFSCIKLRGTMFVATTKMIQLNDAPPLKKRHFIIPCSFCPCNIYRNNFQNYIWMHTAQTVFVWPEFVSYWTFVINSSIKLFICSGLSVLELCPAPFIHTKGIFVFRCHALLYRMHEPA